jgi:hypothetical protein
MPGDLDEPNSLCPAVIPLVRSMIATAPAPSE